MPTINVDLNTGQMYRVFAGKGNTLSDDGVSVVAQAAPEHGAEWEITFDFWTRQDAVRFFRRCAAAAEECAVGEAGERGTLMSEDVTTSWEEINRDA